MKWLVTGGAGYIGSHVVEAFLADNQEVIVLDSLTTGSKDILSKDVHIEVVDIRNESKIESIFRENRIDGVIHLAALKSVSNSITNPLEYNQVNFEGTKNILSACEKFNVLNFVQSSSAAVYGNVKSGYAKETDPLQPLSPYGLSKVNAERALEEYVSKSIVLGTSLRFFNVIGAAQRKLRDKSQDNLIPLVLNSIKNNKSPVIFGDMYPTHDGTCIRDYVHVEDIANAHLLVAKNLSSRRVSTAINIGTGLGYSVREVISEILEQTKSSLKPLVTEPRKGDPAILVANTDRAKSEVGFETKSTFKEMIASSIIDR
jgi:UDP-glucose 4-epimerase